MSLTEKTIAPFTKTPNSSRLKPEYESLASPALKKQRIYRDMKIADRFVNGIGENAHDLAGQAVPGID